ncbi:MAG TPA: DUF4287 domain-containing protein [Candidatus Limnocylindria bacterium]
MTTRKTFKRAVRARAAKTGESYTTARSQQLRRAAPPPDAMELTGMTDAALKRGSGRTIREWLAILDAWGASERKHPEIARWLVAEHGIGGWWAQSVTVGYEKARGMRPLRAQPGGFAVSVTRTIRAAPARISDAFTDASIRARWLPGAPISIRTSKRGKSARFDWDDPPSFIAYNLETKGDGRTKLGLGHEKLPDAAAADRIKSMWRERLTALKVLLETR